MHWSPGALTCVTAGRHAVNGRLQRGKTSGTWACLSSKMTCIWVAGSGALAQRGCMHSHMHSSTRHMTPHALTCTGSHPRQELYYYPKSTAQITVVGEEVKKGLIEQVALQVCGAVQGRGRGRGRGRGGAGQGRAGQGRAGQGRAGQYTLGGGIAHLHMGPVHAYVGPGVVSRADRPGSGWLAAAGAARAEAGAGAAEASPNL